MAKKSKADPVSADPTGPAASLGAEELETKSAAEPAKAKKKRAPAKKKTPRPIKTASPENSSPSRETAREPSDEAIRLRAYFLAERRIQLSLPGDSDQDWVEARRQLLEEARRSI